MLLHLVKKDTLLVKKYMLLMLAAAVVLPVFIKAKTEFLMGGGFFSFFLSTLFIQFLIFNSISVLEFKNKGSAMLSATPYGRARLIQAKYLFLLLLFIGCYMLYTVTALLFPHVLELLALSDVSGAFLILSIIFSIMVPVQYHFGFEKSKYIFFFSIFITPFVVPAVMQFVQSFNLHVSFTLPVPSPMGEMIVLLLALAIGTLSMIGTTRIYAKQNL